MYGFAVPGGGGSVPTGYGTVLSDGMSGMPSTSADCASPTAQTAFPCGTVDNRVTLASDPSSAVPGTRSLSAVRARTGLAVEG
ncbi:hypothetical protein GCM10009616_21520 [Microlunatus lacustris]